MRGSLRPVVIVAVAGLLILGTLVINFFADSNGIGLSFSAALLVVVGAFLMIRAPHNLVGMVLAAGGSAWLIYSGMGAYARLSLASDAGPFPGEYVSAWVGSWAGAVLPASLAALVTLFPDGRVGGVRRWMTLLAVPLVVLTIAGAWLLWGLPVEVLVDSDALDREPRYQPVDLAFVLGFVSVLPATGSLIARYRSGTTVERQQIKWFLAAAGFFGVAFVGGNVLLAAVDGSRRWHGWILALAIGLLPISVALAVVRYRLYDIDRVISRTVSYLLVTAVLVGVYVAVVFVLGSVLPVEGELSTAAATLAAAALFNPLRRRVQELVDRRFNRSRYDAARTVETFSGRLRSEVELTELGEDLCGVATETMQPASVSLWLREEEKKT